MLPMQVARYLYFVMLMPAASAVAAFSPTVSDEALADAALRGFFDVARFLLDGGANPDAVVYGGKTAAGIAKEKGDAALMRLFADFKKNG